MQDTQQELQQYIEEMKALFSNHSIPNIGYLGMSYIKNTLFKWLCINHGKANDSMYNSIINHDIENNKECYNAFMSSDIIRGINSVDSAIEFIYNALYTMQTTYYKDVLTFKQLNTIYKTIYENYNMLGINRPMILDNSIKLLSFVLYAYFIIVNKVYKRMSTDKLAKQVVIGMSVNTADNKQVYTIKITQPIILTLDIDLANKNDIYSQLVPQFTKQPKANIQKQKKITTKDYKSILLSHIKGSMPIQKYTIDDYDTLYKMLFWVISVNDGNLSKCTKLFDLTEESDIKYAGMIHPELFDEYTVKIAEIYNTQDINNIDTFISVIYDAYIEIYNRYDYNKCISQDVYLSLFVNVVYNTMRYIDCNTFVVNMFINGIAAFNTMITYIVNTFQNNKITNIDRIQYDYNNFDSNTITINFRVSIDAKHIDCSISSPCKVFNIPIIVLYNEMEKARQLVFKGLFSEDVFINDIFSEHDYDTILKGLYFIFIDKSNKVMPKDIDNIKDNTYVNNVKRIYKDKYDLITVSLIIFNELNKLLNSILSAKSYTAEKPIITNNFIDVFVYVISVLLMNHIFDIKAILINGMYITNILLHKLFFGDKQDLYLNRLTGFQFSKSGKSMVFEYIGKKLTNMKIPTNDLYPFTNEENFVIKYRQQCIAMYNLLISSIDYTNDALYEYENNIMNNIDNPHNSITNDEIMFVCKVMFNTLYTLCVINTGRAYGDIQTITNIDTNIYRRLFNTFVLIMVHRYLNELHTKQFVYIALVNCIKMLYTVIPIQHTITVNPYVSIVKALMGIYRYDNFWVNFVPNIVYILSVLFQYYLPPDYIDEDNDESDEVKIGEIVKDASLKVNLEQDRAVFTLSTDIYEDITFDILRDELSFGAVAVNPNYQIAVFKPTMIEKPMNGLQKLVFEHKNKK